MPLAAGGLAIIYLLPRVTKAVPSPLVAIVVLTALGMALGLQVRTVGDMGQLPSELPFFLLPDIPLNFETMRIILPTAVTLTIVGLLESLMTASIVDELTDTPSDKNRECWGQGTANIVSGFFGGMAGCAMIGQSVINVKSGGRGRLSTLFAGVFLLFLILVLGDYVRQIPMAALVAVMIMVAIGTFSWRSIRDLRVHPKSSSIVMIATVVVVVWTHDLAQGVLVGVLLSGVFFARKVADIVRLRSEVSGGSRIRTYFIRGNIFFASAGSFVYSFDFKEALEQVTLDVSQAHFWDLTAVAALDRVILKFRWEGAEVTLVGMNEESNVLVGRLAQHDRPGALEQLAAH
jgi:SulP family sulfate permease